MGLIVGFVAFFWANFIMALLIQQPVYRCNFVFCYRLKRHSSYSSFNSVHIADRRTYRFIGEPVVTLAIF